MKITFMGAAGGVTGSAYVVETDRARLLLDFGMFQGEKVAERRNGLPAGLRVASLDCVLVTHGHLDHTGRLPLLARAGYTGPIYCTQPTIEIAQLILRDSARLQAQDAIRQNRKRERAGQLPLEPLYSPQDVEDIAGHFKPVDYDRPVEVAPGVRAKFVEAGHIIGSASICLAVEEQGRTRRVVFSGDIGPWGAPIMKDPEGFHEADVVLLESTYGDRDHKPLEGTVAEFESIVKAAVEGGGKLIVPTFAVGRAQLLLYLLATMFRAGSLHKFPIYIDSPMAVEATRIYLKHLELFDDDFQNLRREKPLEQDLSSVKATASADESKALNELAGPCMIMAGSGMCTGGRILHHLRQNLWRDDVDILIVGFQSEGSLGRQLVDGARTVKIFGEPVAVKARVHTLGGFSAHAGQSDLMKWFEPLAAKRPRLILTHGESKARLALSSLIRQRHGIEAALPALGESIEV